MRRGTGLILALDVPDRARALRIAEAVGTAVDAVKVNYPLALAAGLGVVREIAAARPVVCDFKVADIPNTNRLITEQVFANGAAGLIVHGFPGEDSLRACLDAASGDIFVLTEMSHPGGETFTAGHADAIAAMAARLGAAGIVAPATRPARIRELRKLVGDRQILSPGVGAQGGKAAEAIAAGADFVIVGRAIYEAEDPAAAAGRFVEEIRAATDGPG